MLTQEKQSSRASFWLKDNEKMFVKLQKAKMGEAISQNVQRLKK